ncbi:MAG TPA: hypothetical protein VHD56_11650 [Tepidisphaeraceae bacterium]|nr:hypothetical protein [Tepidisphaeraceae bacterium]
MSNEDDVTEKFGLICLAVWNMMDEEGLSVEDALKAVRTMLIPHSKSRVVSDGIERLERAGDEAELSRLLVDESSRVSRMLHPSESSPKPIVIKIDRYKATLEKAFAGGVAAIVTRSAPRAG